MNTKRGFAWDIFVVSVVVIGVLLAAAWYFLNGAPLPSFLSGDASSNTGVQSNSSSPSCTITSSVKKVTSPNQVVQFSWTSRNASTVTTQSLLSEFDSFQLPLSGSASFQARNNFKITKIGSVTPDKVELTLTAVSAGVGKDCVLDIPYVPQ